MQSLPQRKVMITQSNKVARRLRAQRHFQWLAVTLAIMLIGFVVLQVVILLLATLLAVNPFLLFPADLLGWSEPTAISSGGQPVSWTLLVAGTLKYAFMAVMLATPLAFLAAIYDHFYAPRRWSRLFNASMSLLDLFPPVVVAAAVLWLYAGANLWWQQLLLLISLGLPMAFIVYFLRPYLLGTSVNQHIEKGSVMVKSVAASLVLLGSFFLVIHGSALLLEQSRQQMFTPMLVILVLAVSILPTIYTTFRVRLTSIPIHIQQALASLGSNHLVAMKYLTQGYAFPTLIGASILGLLRTLGETVVFLLILDVFIDGAADGWALHKDIATLTTYMFEQRTQLAPSSSGLLQSSLGNDASSLAAWVSKELVMAAAILVVTSIGLHVLRRQLVDRDPEA